MVFFLMSVSYGLLCFGLGIFFGTYRKPQLPAKSQTTSKVRVNNTPTKPTDRELQDAWDEVEKEFPTKTV